MQVREVDPFVAEVRAIRETYAARFGNDVAAMFRDIAARQQGPVEALRSEAKDLRPSSPDPDMALYAQQMEEIKRRFLVLSGFLRGEIHARFIQTTAESVALQFRKILECLALASLVAQRDVYSQFARQLGREWNGKKILANLEKANPAFYPVPTKQVLNPQTGRVVETIRVERGFLAKEDFIRLYDACGAMLHAHNPFAETHPDARSFLAEAPTWMERICVLLNHHQIQLASSDRQWWVLMEAASDGKVHVFDFQRVQNPGESPRGHRS